MKKTAVLLGGFFVFSVNIYGIHAACPEESRVRTDLMNSFRDLKSNFASQFKLSQQLMNGIKVGNTTITESSLSSLKLDERDKTKGCQYKVSSGDVLLTIPMPAGR